MDERMDIIDQRLAEIDAQIVQLKAVIETYFFKKGVDWRRLSDKDIITDHLEELFTLVTEKNVLTKLVARAPRSADDT